MKNIVLRLTDGEIRMLREVINQCGSEHDESTVRLRLKITNAILDAKDEDDHNW